jgi:mannose-6-phosphate isomerase class I
MPRRSNYDKFPFIPVSASQTDCLIGWRDVAARIRAATAAERCIVCVECYPGVFVEEVEQALVQGLDPALVVRASECLKSPSEIEEILAPYLGGDDPVFGRMNHIELDDFFDPALFAKTEERIAGRAKGLILVIGTGAALIAPGADILILADLARWEIQQRQRRGAISNLGAENRDQSASLKYKRSYFVDWRAADRLKQKLLAKIDFLLDTNDRRAPKLLTGDALRRGLLETVRRPFRVVPFFDPGPWGGHWMEEVCDLPLDAPNHAWCFDCVPEENSLLFGFGGIRVEMPAINLVFQHPRALLGEKVYARFGAEFPIRFDFLDTMGGGNLSFQVHPLTEFVREKFGMSYTQDESYYLLDAAEDGSVYLGLKEGIDRAAMIRDLSAAQEGMEEFPVEKFVNRWPAKKHDHFLIPAGTVHCSGKNSVVLEISATPYIFTFKLWDWGRMGLDGKPRPIHLEYGEANIQWDRTTEWVRRNLINRIEPAGQGQDWREERTGLHEREFIETRRHWFRGAVPHDTRGGVNVLNLVQGEEAVIESPGGAFEPFLVHYAETFIVPAAVGAYTIRPSGSAKGKECATIKAYVRTSG